MHDRNEKWIDDVDSNNETTYAFNYGANCAIPSFDNQNQYTMIFLLLLFFAVIHGDTAAAFCIKKRNHITLIRHPQQQYRRFMSMTPSEEYSPSKSSYEFALQELRAQLRSMKRANVTPRMLAPEKLKEIESYLSILGQCPSPISLKTLNDNNAQKLLGTFWLGFTSEQSSLGLLPRDANVYLKVYPNYTCDYCITFDGTSLQSLIAKSTFSVDRSSGLFRFIYKDIVADVFGLKSIPVFFFGILGGMEKVIETVWFDGNLWVERTYGQNGEECYNIYIKDNN